MAKKEVGHNFLARLGKTRLRPGGREATDWLLDNGEIDSNSKVLEVACNRGTTMMDMAKRFGCQVVGVDINKGVVEQANENFKDAGLDHLLSAKVANALNLPYEDESFDVVVNEAMLTMMDNKAKERLITEYKRVLKPGGRLLTHDVSLLVNDEEVVDTLRDTINANVTPLSPSGWRDLFSSLGFSVDQKVGPMTLMSPKGLIYDEGLSGALKIIRNGLKAENREQFMKMANFFNKNQDKLGHIVTVSTK